MLPIRLCPRLSELLRSVAWTAFTLLQWVFLPHLPPMPPLSFRIRVPPHEHFPTKLSAEIDYQQMCECCVLSTAHPGTPGQCGVPRAMLSGSHGPGGPSGTHCSHRLVLGFCRDRANHFRGGGDVQAPLLKAPTTTKKSITQR